ncbi:MAG: ABC transporter permease [Saprospiraceae bacterium]
MLKHNLKIAFRNFKKDKSPFMLNLIGLSTGLACAIMIFMWVNDELSVDKFHENDEQLLRLFSNYNENGQISTELELPPLLANVLQEEVSEIKLSAGSSSLFSSYALTVEDVSLKAKGRFVTDNFFQLFSFEMLEGDSKKLFPNKSGIVISEELAQKFFPNTKSVLGKIITYESKNKIIQAAISGVFKKTPKNSTIQFDYLLAYDQFVENLGMNYIWNNYVAEIYVLLHQDVEVNQFNKKVASFLTTKTENAEDILWAQKVSDRYLQGEYKNGKIVGGRITYVKLFSLIALFILLIACINFMNLSTANATKKFKEIGVKKTIGADRQTLIFQYLSESMTLSFFSLFIAFGLIYSFLPSFNLITGKNLSIEITASAMAAIFGITLLTGLISGSYPAFYLSGFKPARIFKGNIKNSWGELWARKGLVVFQFAISLILIVSVVVIFKQIEFIQNKKLGFNRDNIIHFQFNDTEVVSQDIFISEVKKIPSVINASSMWGSFVNDVSDTNGSFDWEGKRPDHDPTIHYVHVNYEMLDMLSVEMLEGRTFDKKYGNEYEKIIFNEAGIKLMGLENPVGKTFNLWGDNFEIIGVAKDFHFESLYENIQPFFFRLLKKNNADKIMVKIKGGEEQNVLAQLENLYKKNHPNLPFEYHFLDSDYQELYESEKRVSTLSKYFAGFAIIISCLGLFGLAAFTAQRRIKEISIRKVLGANPFSIIRLLTLDFTKMVLVAIFIGIPISYFVAKSWLNDFVFKIDLSIWFFVMAGLLTLAIAWLTVSLQTMKAARVNPVNNLKE